MKRYSLYLDEEIMKEIKDVAAAKQRSVSFIVSSLLFQALKEKNRKKKHPIQNPA